MVGRISVENVHVFTDTPHGNLNAEEFVAYLRKNAARPVKQGALRHIGPDSIVMEAGCGAGGKLLTWGARGARVYGVDGSPVQIERIKGHAAALGVSGDFRQSWLEGFEKAVVGWPQPDLLICSAVIHHVHGWKDLIGQLSRVMKPDGRLFLTWCDPTLSLAGFNIKNQIAYRMGWNSWSRRWIGTILFGWWDWNRNEMKLKADSFFADLYAAYYIPITAGRMVKELRKHGLEVIESAPAMSAKDVRANHWIRRVPFGTAIVRLRFFFRLRHGPRVFVCAKKPG